MSEQTVAGPEASQNGVTGDATHDDAERTPAGTSGTSEEQPTDDDTAPEDLNRREARYRTERNEARAERDRLAGVVENLQRNAVEGLLGNQIKPAAFWASVGEQGVGSLLNDDGVPDAGKVNAAIASAIEMFGLGPRKPAPVKALGRTYDDWDDRKSAQDEWANAFGPREYQ